MVDARSVDGRLVMVQWKHFRNFGTAFHFRSDKDGRTIAERPRGGVVT